MPLCMSTFVQHESLMRMGPPLLLSCMKEAEGMMHKLTRTVWSIQS